MSVESVLSECVVGTADRDIPAAALDAAAVQVFDTIGVAVAAAAEPAGRSIASVVGRLGESHQARLLGSGIGKSTASAAWANGSLAHLLDFDDSGFSHPSACIVPAALATSEWIDGSVESFLVAMVLGYEIFERLSASARTSEWALRKRGLHPTSIYGGVAAAAAAGRLLKLDERQMVAAFGIAATQASGLTQHFGSWAKGLNAGNAAHGGVMAAILASEGYQADEEGLSGPYGLFAAFHGEGGYSFDSIDGGLGTTWAILDPGLTIKIYPACGINRRAVDAVLKLRREHGISADDIVEIMVHVQPVAFETLRFRAPTKGFQGKFSLDFTVAAAALDGAVTIDSFTDESARRPAFRNMLDRITLVTHPEWDESRYKEIAVELRRDSGDLLRESLPAPRGSRAWPLSDEEIIEKFVDCASRWLPHEVALAAAERTWAMRSVEHVKDLMDAVVGRHPVAGSGAATT